MTTGYIKTYDSEAGFGFIASSEGGDVYVNAADITGSAAPGAVVDFELTEDERGKRRAVTVNVTKDAPPANPVGRTMVQPPSWDEIEQRERERRAARRRRR